jgi:ribosomal protein S3
MGQKTHPVGFRLAVTRNWQSRWFASKKDFPGLLLEDQIIRTKLMEKLKQASVPRIFIERASNRVRVKIFTARPGIVIGRKGQEIEKIKDELAKLTGKEILLDIQEVKKPEIEAPRMAAQGPRAAAHPPGEHRLRFRGGPHPLRQDRRQVLDLQKRRRHDQLTAFANDDS